MNEKKHYISLARVIAAIMIITLHTDETWVHVSASSDWLIDNMIIGVTRFAVPIFFMITGATLMDYHKRYDTKTFFIKRMKNVILPLLSWYFIALLFENKTGKSGISFLFWFLFALIGLYLCIPLFSALKENLKEKVILSVIFISFTLNYLLPFIADTLHVSISNVLPPFYVGEGFLIYVLIGYIIHEKTIPLRWRIIFYVFAIIGYIIIVVGTYTRSLNTGVLDDTFGNTLNLPCLLWSTGVFIFFKQMDQYIKNEKFIKILTFLSSYALSSYVLHQYVLRFFIKYYISDVSSILYKLGTPLLNFAICILIASVIKKIPILKKILP